MTGAILSLFGATVCLAASLAFPGAAAPAELLDPTVRAYIQRHLNAGFIDGLAIGIVQGDRVETHAFGTESPASDAKPNGDSVYQIASLTKVFNGVLLALLTERGLLALDQTLPGTFEECPLPANKGRPITLLDLATHRSGLAHMPSNLPSQDPLDPMTGFTPELLCAHLTEALPLAEPERQRVNYSNVGMGLLGRIMAEQTGLTWEQLFLHEIARPLGMESTAVTLTPAMRERLVMPFDRDGRPLKVWDVPTLEGAGALKSTVNDLLLFLQANLQEGDSELARALVLAREAPGRLDEALAYQGLGWFLRPLELFYEHTGATSYRSYFGLHLEKKIGVVVLSNTHINRVDSIGLRVLRALERR